MICISENKEDNKIGLLIFFNSSCKVTLTLLAWSDISIMKTEFEKIISPRTQNEERRVVNTHVINVLKSARVNSSLYTKEALSEQGSDFETDNLRKR